MSKELRGSLNCARAEIARLERALAESRGRARNGDEAEAEDSPAMRALAVTRRERLAALCAGRFFLAFRGKALFSRGLGSKSVSTRSESSGVSLQ